MKLARIALIVMVGAATAHAQNKEAHEKEEAGEAAKNGPALAAALKDAKLSLADGLKAAEKSGTPISAKFELEDIGFSCRGEDRYAARPPPGRSACPVLATRSIAGTCWLDTPGPADARVATAHHRRLVRRLLHRRAWRGNTASRRCFWRSWPQRRVIG